MRARERMWKDKIGEMHICWMIMVIGTILKDALNED